MSAALGPEPGADPAATAEIAPPEDLDPVVEAFDGICRRLAGFDDTLDTEWADGYLTAVAASWRAIPLDEALPLMCGEAFARAFADPTDEAAARQALQARLGQLRADLDPEALLDDPDRLRLAPLMQVWDDAARSGVRLGGWSTHHTRRSCTAKQASSISSSRVGSASFQPLAAKVRNSSLFGSMARAATVSSSSL